MASTSAESASEREQLYHLRVLVEQALSDSNELHHRIREIQLRLLELSASVEKGRTVAAVRGTY
jgi:hypothetical protein